MSIAQKIVRPAAAFIGAMADRVWCVVCAVAAAQFPVYVNLYINVLAGARAEATISYNALRLTALSFHLSPRGFVQHLLESPDRIAQASGKLHEAALLRYERYNAAYDALTTADMWHKPFALYQYFDATLHEALVFTPNIPFTLEGLFYASAGLLLALCIALGVRAGIQKLAKLT